MLIDDINIYAFNKREKEILINNENVKKGKVHLSSKDIKVYFLLKANKTEIGVTELVKKCLIEQGYDLESEEMYTRRAKVTRRDYGEYYENGYFSGNTEFRVDTFSRSLNKLLKAGLIKKRKAEFNKSLFETIVKD